MTHQIYEESLDVYVLYFHGNAEDLGSSLNFLKQLRDHMRTNIIAVEYPGYGLYNKKVSASQIKSDALHIYDTLIQMGIDQSKIIVIGRSIGSGPACEIGAKRKPGTIILISPFTSIKKLSGEIAFNLVSYFVKERFNNIENVKHFNSPCLLIHGQADPLIKFEHTQQIEDALNKKGNMVKAYFPEKMTHNKFQMASDILRPIQVFLKRISFCIVKLKTQNLPQIFQKSLVSNKTQSNENQQIIMSQMTKSDINDLATYKKQQMNSNISQSSQISNSSSGSNGLQESKRNSGHQKKPSRAKGISASEIKKDTNIVSSLTINQLSENTPKNLKNNGII